MITAVVPAQNEEGRILKAIKRVSQSSVDKILVIVNGCYDNTLLELLLNNPDKTQIFYFQESLGIDVPRSVGAYISRELKADVTVFVDGDMTGNITNVINQLIASVKSNHSDLALTNCYPSLPYYEGITAQTLKFRKLLNEVLGIYSHIGFSTPSHGPHAVSQRLLASVNIEDFGVPPILLAQAVHKNMKITVPAAIPHHKLESKPKNFFHAKLIAETIIGDSIEAINFFQGKQRNRVYDQDVYQGYNPYRRWDLLNKIKKNDLF